MKNLHITLTCLFFISINYSQTHNIFHIGHSLVNHDMPAMLKSFADSTPGANHTYENGIINGAPLFWHWDNSATCEGYQATTIDSKVVLNSGAHDVFVMTEGVPWDPILSDFHAYADSFYTLALSGNPNIQTYLYETWNCINTGLPAGCMYDNGDTILWVNRIRQDITTWESVADSLMYKHPSATNPVYIIPAGQAFARLSDSINAGSVPGISSYTQLFSDDIHNNDTGKYFVALVHYACIYQQNPVGLPTQTYSQWGVPFTNISASLALKLQEIAWEAVCNYPRSGVNCFQTTKVNELSKKKVSIYPNPAQNTLNIKLNEQLKTPVKVFNQLGALVMEINTTVIDVSTLKNGVYYLNLNNTSTKFIVNR